VSRGWFRNSRFHHPTMCHENFDVHLLLEFLNRRHDNLDFDPPTRSAGRRARGTSSPPRAWSIFWSSACSLSSQGSRLPGLSLVHVPCSFEGSEAPLKFCRLLTGWIAQLPFDPEDGQNFAPGASPTCSTPRFPNGRPKLLGKRVEPHRGSL
jgi:hypothetical protein